MCMHSKQKNKILNGVNIFNGEYNVPILKIMIKNLSPSLDIFNLLLPALFSVSMGTYATGNPLRKKAIVIVVG